MVCFLGGRGEVPGLFPQGHRRPQLHRPDTVMAAPGRGGRVLENGMKFKY